MHRPPAIEIPVGRVPAIGWALGAVLAAGALAVCAYSYQVHSGNVLSGERVTALVLALVAAAAAAGWYWLTQAVGTLAFSGSEWRWLHNTRFETVPAPGVHLDLQRLVLLRVTLARGGAWLWLAPGADDERWRALRRALYSRSSGAPIDAGTVAVAP